MKKTFTLFALALCGVFGAMAGNVKESSVPPVVKSYITKNYPQAANIDWNYEEQGNFYKAAFTLNNANYDFDIAPTGELINSQQQIVESALPDSVRAYIGQQFPGFKIKDAWKIERRGIVTYRTDISGSNTDQTPYFSADGHLLKKS